MELRTITHMYETSTLPPRQQGGGDDVHVAQPGDTVDTIAHQYGAPAGLIRQLNPQIRDDGRIPVGDAVNLPGNGNPAQGIPVGSTELPHVGIPVPGNSMPGSPGSGGGLPILDVIVRTVFPSSSSSPLPLSLPLGGDVAPRNDQAGVVPGLPKSDVTLPVSVPDRSTSDTHVTSPPADTGGQHAITNDAPLPPTNPDDAPKSASSTNTGTANNATTAANATSPAQMVAVVVSPGSANVGVAAESGPALPTAAGSQMPTATILVSAPTVSLARDVPTTAAGVLQPALATVVAAPEETSPATQSERRDLSRPLESNTTGLQGRGEAEKPANDSDPARLLRDVQARILSDPRTPNETTRASAFADQNLKSQEKSGLIPKASGDATAEEVLKNAGLLLSERPARASIRQTGDPSALFDWVGQLAQLKQAYARTRAADSTDLPTTAAVIGTVVVLIAGLFALYALYRYWAPH